MFTVMSRRADLRAPLPKTASVMILLTLGIFSIAPGPAQGQTAETQQGSQPATERDNGDAVKIPQVVVTAPNAPKKPKAAQAKTPSEAPIVPVAGELPPVKLQQTPTGLQNPSGQTVTNLDSSRNENVPVFSIGDVLKESPGLSIKQGNGPRDVGISIRGSNARNGFGVRNIQVFEDGFPVTQPDGLSRTDLTDPHAYKGVDVYRGPSSALFGNYATGGAINFRTREGSEISGGSYGVDAGSFGYLNNYLIAGGKSGDAEAALFASDVRGGGYIGNGSFNTQTINSLISFGMTPNDKVTIKFIDNQLYGNLPIRLSLNQYKTNPYQQGCERAATAAAGCGTVNLFINGVSGPTIPQTAAEAGLHRDDRRTILGTRWEHSFDENTVWRTQFVFDDRDIQQPTGATSAIGDFPSYNIMSDLTHRGTVLGMNATHLFGLFYNTMTWSSNTVNLEPGGNARLGSLASIQAGTQTNGGVRAREEIEFAPRWIAAFGADIENTTLDGDNRILASGTRIAADREFLNTGREAMLTYRPSEAWQFRGRVATAYGTPQLGNLFVTSTGADGDNTQLKPQTNLGYDLGFDWHPTRNITLSVTGFYEFFENELVNQSPGAGLKTFTFNAPASEHRGIEIAADWAVSPGWRLTAAYSYDDQFYTDYVERLSTGNAQNGVSTAFNRAGNKIPGVSPNELVARIRYDQADGAWKGFGGFLEYQWKDAFFMDNGNLLKAPGYDLFNFNLHYKTALNNSIAKEVSVFFEIENIFDEKYVASANNISNSINSTGAQNPASVLANSTGSIYAGAPRTFLSGMKVSF